MAKRILSPKESHIRFLKSELEAAKRGIDRLEIHGKYDLATLEGAQTFHELEKTHDLLLARCQSLAQAISELEGDAE